MVLPPKLIQAINSGRCFALVGSGPSCEAGYPTWGQLAVAVLEKLRSSGRVDDDSSYQMYLDKREYPEFFQLAEYDAGGRNKLVEILKEVLVPGTYKSEQIYGFLTKWPFAVYLTTNYDDGISDRLTELGVHYTTLQNTASDLSQLREGATNLVVKLHSDFDHPHLAVITAKDYKKYAVDDEGAYFRARLRALMETFDILIIGHSLSDIDFRIILQAAQQTGSPKHPIYMIASGFSPADERLFFEQYRIVLIRYDNADGKHAQLKRLLATHNRFIVERNETASRAKFVAEPGPELDAASALFLYQKLSGPTRPDTQGDWYLRPLIIGLLRGQATALSIDDLVAQEPLTSLAARNPGLFRTQLNAAVEALQADGVVNVPDLTLTAVGANKANEILKAREVLRDQALGQFSATMATLHPQVCSADRLKAADLLERILVGVFKRRGVAIGNAIFADRAIAHDDLSDIFAVIYQSTREFSDEAAKVALIDTVHEFLTHPSPPQQDYLAALSQGFFLHHLLGLDPSCSRIRLDIFSRTMWFCDASTLIPLLAKGCQNHRFADSLFTLLRARGARLFVTRQMLREVFEHLDWAVSFVRSNPSINSSFLAAALVKPGYKQNLFLDGYIRTSADGKVAGFDEYLELVSPKVLSAASLARSLSAYGIRITDMSLHDGYEPADHTVARDLSEHIKMERQMVDSYRTEAQVSAEAEVLHIIQSLRAKKYKPDNTYDHFYFVSQSTVLDRVSTDGVVTTWSPEAVYRYLTALPAHPPDPELLQQCMLSQYYQSGISFIDRDKYGKFFGAAISSAKASYQEQKEKYISAIESVSSSDLDNQFQSTPDLEKPLFVARLNLRSVAAARAATERAMDQVSLLKARVRQLEAEKDKKWREKAKTRASQEVSRKKRSYPAKKQKK